MARKFLALLLLLLLVAMSVAGATPAAASIVAMPLLGLPIHAMHLDGVVAKDGTGTDTTITAAVARSAAATGPRTRRYWVIYVKKGTYEERVIIEQPDVVLIGDGAGETIITGKLCNKTGHNMPDSATLTALGPGFMARDLTIENTAGAADDKQAVAFRSTSEKSVLFRCRIRGFQDTLCAGSGLQFYRDCTISGTVDFVFGDATAVFQNCLLLVRRPSDVRQHNVITAQGREHRGHSGFSFQNCTVTTPTGENLTGVETYLGRPWRPYSLVVFMLCSIDDVVHADGWVSWKKGEVNKNVTETVVYREYKNHGLGADVSRRIEWRGFHVIKTDKQAEAYTAERFINGRDWLRESGVDYYLGL